MPLRGICIMHATTASLFGCRVLRALILGRRGVSMKTASALELGMPGVCVIPMFHVAPPRMRVSQYLREHFDGKEWPEMSPDRRLMVAIV